MKRIILMTGLLFCSGCALATPPASHFSMRAVDFETGIPVTNAVVEVTFIEREDPWGNGVGKEDRQKKPVDENGVATFSGCSIGNGCGGSINADGYYQSTKGLMYSGKNILLNRWEPWGPTIEVRMRPKKKPVPMVNKQTQWVKFPVFGVPITYDLEVGDWTAPYGKGIASDLIFNVTTSENPSRAEYTLTFSTLEDGIMEYQFPEDCYSSFKWPYVAPELGYIDRLNKYKVYKNPSSPETNIKDEVNYIFRVRTKIDKKGHVSSACYGLIIGDIELTTTGEFKFGYWFNPDPFSRSLEYNGENLLEK
jgi:hypothetical protein